MTINLKTSEEQRQELLKQVKEDEQKKKQRKRMKKKSIKIQLGERVFENFNVLQELSEAITGVKKQSLKILKQ